MPRLRQWRDELWRREAPIQDRRANSRIQSCLPCELQAGQETWHGYLVSISLTGALVSSRRGVPKNSDVSIVIEVPGSGKRVSLKGRAVRTNSLTRGERDEETCLFGVCFNSLSYESMLLLKGLLADSRQRH